MNQFVWYIRVAAIWCIISVLFYIPLFFIFKRKGKGVLRQAGYFAFIFSIFIIVFATLIYKVADAAPERHVLNLTPFLWWAESLRAGQMNRLLTEIAPNIMLFIPVGIFMPVVIKRTRKYYIIVTPLLFISLLIEFIQYFTGRSSDIDDIIMNVIGGIIGYAIFKGLNCLFKNKVWWGKFTD